jgi:hypothetical protein
MHWNFIKNLGTAFIVLQLGLLPLAAHALSPDDLALNIHIDGDMTKAEDDYKASVAALSPAQRLTLDNLDKAAMMADEPQFELTAKSIELGACGKLDPTLEMTHGAMMQTFVFTKLDEMGQGWMQFAKDVRKIDFMDQDKLSRHIEYNRSLQTQLMTEAGNAVAKQIVANKDVSKCRELTTELETKYKKPYVTPARQKPAEIAVVRGEDGETILSCATGFDDRLDNGTILNVSLAYTRHDGESAPVLEFSGTAAGKDHKAVNVQDAWLNFGAMDTRFVAAVTQPSPDVITGRMKPDMAVSALFYMKDKKVVAGVMPEGASKPVVYEAERIPAKAINRLAACIAAMTPVYADPLKKMGFSLSPDDLK